MSLAAANGRRIITFRRPDFASIKAVLTKQKRDLSRAWRRHSAALPPKLHRDAPRGALQAGIEPLRLLQAILARADMIALDVPERRYAQQAHLLVTVPVTLLERATVVASYDVDDEETGDDEPEDDQDGEDAEPSLATPDAIIDQTHQGFRCGSDAWGREFDTADDEPSLGSIDEAVNQEHWADGNRLDLERGEKGGDGDDDEDTDGTEEDDLEPDHDDEPSLSSTAPGMVGPLSDYGVIDGEESGYSHRTPKDAAIRARLRGKTGEGHAAPTDMVRIAEVEPWSLVAVGKRS